MTTSTLPITRPVVRATNFDAPVFENVDLALYDVFAAAVQKGPGLIQGRTFRGCRIQGPAIMLVTDGVRFNDTNFGDSLGDIANLVVRPIGHKVIGSVPVRDCVFESCEFYGVGFTGLAPFIDQILALGGDPTRAPGAPA